MAEGIHGEHSGPSTKCRRDCRRRCERWEAGYTGWNDGNYRATAVYLGFGPRAGWYWRRMDGYVTEATVAVAGSRYPAPGATGHPTAPTQTTPTATPPASSARVYRTLREFYWKA